MTEKGIRLSEDEMSWLRDWIDALRRVKRAGEGGDVQDVGDIETYLPYVQDMVYELARVVSGEGTREEPLTFWEWREERE